MNCCGGSNGSGHNHDKSNGNSGGISWVQAVAIGLLLLFIMGFLLRI